MTDHTPTPWICDSEGILPISRDGVSVIARIPNHPENQKNWDADAAFIVKAVNNHEALVDALQTLDTLLDFGDDALDNVWTFEDLTSIQAAFDKAKAALAGVNVGGSPK